GNAISSAGWSRRRSRGNAQRRRLQPPRRWLHPHRRRLRLNTMRAFAWFLGVILLAGVIGASIAYPAYELSTTFATWAFHRVASRIAMLVLVAELVWLCRHLQLKTKRDFGYGLPWRRFLGQSLSWGVVGMATASLGAAFLLLTHLRVMDGSFVPSA